MQSNTQLYLVDTGRETIGTVSRVVPKLLNALPVSAIALASARVGDPMPRDALVDRLRDIVADVQGRGIAALITDDADVMSATNADGLHLTWRTDIGREFAQMHRRLGRDLILGADAGRSRHEAMLIAESEADYVAFGVPETVKDQVTARRRQLQLLEWWAEIVEVPSVAFDIVLAEQARKAMNSGADFVAVTLPPCSGDEAQLIAWTAQFQSIFAPPAETA